MKNSLFLASIAIAVIFGLAGTTAISHPEDRAQKVEAAPRTIRLSSSDVQLAAAIGAPQTAPVQRWETTVDGMNSRYAPVIANVTGDSKLEILIDHASRDGFPRGTGRVALLDSSGAVLPGWPVDPDPAKRQMVTSMAIGDITGDGANEVIVGTFWTTDGYIGVGTEIYAFNGTGQILPGFPLVRIDEDTLYPTIVLADMDASAGSEMVVVTSEFVTIYDADGSQLPGWPQPVSSTDLVIHPAVGDLNNDGIMDITFFTTTSGTTGQGHAFSANGSYLSGWPITGPGRVCAAQAVIANIDATGTKEVLTTSCQYGNAGVFMYRSTGVAMTPILASEYSKYLGQTLTPVDMNTDGDLEILVPTSGPAGTVDAWHHTGVAVTGWPKAKDGTSDKGAASVVAGDVDNDGKAELILGTYTLSATNILAWNDDGTVLSGFPISQPLGATNHPRNGAIAITDIDADGLVDLVEVRSADSIDPSIIKTEVTMYEFASTFHSGRNQWPTFQHDAAHTGTHTPQSCILVKGRYICPVLY